MHSDRSDPSASASANVSAVGGRPRLGVDFHVLDGKPQGSRSHLLELFAPLIRLSPDIEFFLFLQDVEQLRSVSDAYRAKNVHLVEMKLRDPLARLTIQLPRLAKRYGCNLLHCQYILPPFAGVTGVVTIHDILFETHPEYFDPFFRLRSRLLVKRSARRAAGVFTVSQYSKSMLIERYGIEARKIDVIPNAADPARFYPGEGEAHILRKYGLSSGNYVLNVGRLEPRKNQTLLIEAYAELDPGFPPLVIVGTRDFNFRSVFDAVSRLRVGKRVVILERVPDADLPALYRHARIFVYPSFAEGFGMPPLEALASGVPVIAANTTAMPEVVGSAGLLIDPTQPAAITRALRDLHSDERLQRRLKQDGPRRASAFSWKGSAQIVRARYLETYASLRKPVKKAPNE